MIIAIFLWLFRIYRKVYFETCTFDISLESQAIGLNKSEFDYILYQTL